MIQKINKTPHDKGFIQILYPGLSIEGSNDSGIGSIGRIDHAYIAGNHTIPMHPHANDEILSYFRSGKGLHRDSEGFEEYIGKEKMMLMKAGKIFYHEEKMIDEGEPLEGLQIFIRPSKKDLTPEVHFWDLDQLHSENQWRMVASPEENAPFQFSSKTWIYDVKLTENQSLKLPKFTNELSVLLYVFKGEISVKDIVLTAKESLYIKEEFPTISTKNGAELVLFITDENAEIYKDGMYSGNKSKASTRS